MPLTEARPDGAAWPAGAGATPPAGGFASFAGGVNCRLDEPSASISISTTGSTNRTLSTWILPPNKGPGAIRISSLEAVTMSGLLAPATLASRMAVAVSVGAGSNETLMSPSMRNWRPVSATRRRLISPL